MYMKVYFRTYNWNLDRFPRITYIFEKKNIFKFLDFKFDWQLTWLCILATTWTIKLEVCPCCMYTNRYTFIRTQTPSPRKVITYHILTAPASQRYATPVLRYWYNMWSLPAWTQGIYALSYSTSMLQGGTLCGHVVEHWANAERAPNTQVYNVQCAPKKWWEEIYRLLEITKLHLMKIYVSTFDKKNHKLHLVGPSMELCMKHGNIGASETELDDGSLLLLLAALLVIPHV